MENNKENREKIATEVVNRLTYEQTKVLLISSISKDLKDDLVFYPTLQKIQVEEGRHLMIVEEATKRAKDRATEEQLKAATKYVDGKEIIAIEDLLTEQECEKLITEVAKEWGVYK